MNERYRIDSEAIRDFLAKEDRKQSYLSRRLNCSDALVDRMLGKGHVPKERTLIALAELMGTEVGKLLIPKETQKSA